MNKKFGRDSAQPVKTTSPSTVQKRKPPPATCRGRSSSEADGTRTRHHRIDSLNPVVQPPPSEGAKPPSEGQEPGSVGTGWVPVEGGFGGGLDALLDALDRADGGQSIPAAEAILYCLCTACNAKGFSRVIPQECPRCGATEGFTVSLVVSPIRRTGLNQRGKF